MKDKEKIRIIIGTALLAGLVVVLQFISNYVKFGPFSINLALIPIAVGAILFGPISGLFLGFVCGFIILISGGGEPFFSFNPFFTIILCLFKTGIAGLVAGFTYKALKNKNDNIGIIVSSLLVPITNTLLFLVGALTIFKPMIQEWADGGNIIIYSITTMIGINFLIEFSVIVILSSSILYIVHTVNPKKIDDTNKNEG